VSELSFDTLTIIGGLMIANSSIIIMFFNGIVCFALPIGGYIWYKRKPEKYIGLFIAGALSFYVSQLIIRIPILQLVLPRMQWYVNLADKSGWLYPVGIALFLGGTAALFETGGRLITLNFLLKKKLSYRSGIIHGLGHGGFEAIMLVGINNLIYAVYGLQFNAGKNMPLIGIIPAEQQELLQNILIKTPTSEFLAAGVERVLTIILHVALSLLITIGIVKGKKLLYSIIVILAHTFVDASVVIAANYTNEVWILEGIVALYALIAAIVIITQKTSINDRIDIDDAVKAVDEGY